ASASLLYAKNLVTFLETMVDKEQKTLSIDMEDELVKATMLTHDGQVVNEAFKELAASAKAAAPSARAGAKKEKPAASDPDVKKAARGTEPGLDAAPKKKTAKAASPAGAKPKTTARRKAAPKTDN